MHSKLVLCWMWIVLGFICNLHHAFLIYHATEQVIDRISIFTFNFSEFLVSFVLSNVTQKYRLFFTTVYGDKGEKGGGGEMWNF